MESPAGSGCEIVQPESELKSNAEIERALICDFRKTAWTPFTKAVREYRLVNEGDSIAAAVSGGKDSILMAKLMQELQRHSRVKFDLHFISLDPGFSKANLDLLKKNCGHLEIDTHIFNRGLFKVVDNMAREYPCYLCARMRRGALYATAQELGCNKVALGHHFDDVIETILLNVLCSGKYQTMMPKLRSDNFKNMELIRPMYYIREDDIKKIISWCGINAMNCGCLAAAEKISSKRHQIKKLIKNLGRTFRDVDKSIFQSSRNVFQDAVIEWVDGEERKSFLDEY